MVTHYNLAHLNILYRELSQQQHRVLDASKEAATARPYEGTSSRIEERLSPPPPLPPPPSQPLDDERELHGLRLKHLRELKENEEVEAERERRSGNEDLSLSRTDAVSRVRVASIPPAA